MSVINDGLIQEARRLVGTVLPPPTLEEVLTEPGWFGLTTASPGQRMMCRLASGNYDGARALRIDASPYLDDIESRCNLDFMLNATEWDESVKPIEIGLLAGIRSGKSLIAAAVAVHASQTVDVSGLRPGEKCRFSILSIDKDKARAVLMHLYSSVEHSPRVRDLVVGDVRVDGVDLRHPSGTIVEIRVIAGKRAGGGLVSYWSAGVVFDEAPRMVGEEEGVVNFEASRKAVLGRLLPGAQLWAIGSPWAPMGPIYTMVESHWGKPGTILVVRAPAPALNPIYWTPEKCEHMRHTDNEAFRMDVLGEWGTPEMAMFSEPELRLVLREHELPPVPGEYYYAAMDPASRGNAWTFVLGGIRRSTGKPTLYAARQWVPDGSTGVMQVIKEIKQLCDQYGVEYVRTDQWAADPIIEMGRMAGVTVVDEPWTRRNKVKAYDSLRVLVQNQNIELVDAPLLMTDLLRVKRVLTQDGVSIKLPETLDGRHCDYAPSVAMWAHHAMDEPDRVDETRDLVAEEEERMMADEETAGKRPWTYRRQA